MSGEPIAVKTMTAEWVENDPGMACTPRGGSEKPVGEMKPADPAVYCCKPLEDERAGVSSASPSACASTTTRAAPLA